MSEQETVEITFMLFPPQPPDIPLNQLNKDNFSIVSIGYGVKNKSKIHLIMLEELDRYDRIQYEIRKLMNANHYYLHEDRQVNFLPPILWACMYFLFLKHNVKIITSDQHPGLDPIKFLLHNKPIMSGINCPYHYDTRIAWEILEKQRDLEQSEKFALDWENSLKESERIYLANDRKEELEKTRKHLTTELPEYMAFIRRSRDNIASMKAQLDKQLSGSGNIDSQNRPKEWADLETEMSKWTKRLPALSEETKRLIDEE